MRWMMTILLIVTVVGASAQRTGASHIIAANKMYREQKFDRALPEYLKAKELKPADPVLNFNLGDDYFRISKFEDAVKSFDNSIAVAPDSAFKQKGYYNKGVSLSKQSKLEESIAAYKMAVKMDPADEDARVNLQKALTELKKKTPPPPEKKDEKKQKQQNQNKRPQPPQSNLSRKQVEQLLKALQQREQQVQQKMQQRNRTAGRQEKDW
ncbi:MAG: tetratricopeptide repeat protein [Chitinophagaceae bacterium]|nr:tetratricopeptide repeat protein [Chitinophagaceae bacterium]